MLSLVSHVAHSSIQSKASLHKVFAHSFYIHLGFLVGANTCAVLSYQMVKFEHLREDKTQGALHFLLIGGFFGLFAS